MPTPASPPPDPLFQDTPEMALARYLATVKLLADQKREVRLELEDAKIHKSRRPFWWLKD